MTMPPVTGWPAAIRGGHGLVQGEELGQQVGATLLHFDKDDRLPDEAGQRVTVHLQAISLPLI